MKKKIVGGSKHLAHFLLDPFLELVHSALPGNPVVKTAARSDPLPPPCFIRDGTGGPEASPPGPPTTS